MFFGSSDTTDRPALSVADIARAREICHACPVFRTCLTTALSSPREEYGIWAGTSGRTRRRIWEAIERGEVTLESVVDDFDAGRCERFESKVPMSISEKVDRPLLVPMREMVSA